LNITAQGMHAALKRVEIERGGRCNPVVSADDASETTESTDVSKMLQ
jgi:hypothetical protein